jgi:hypothetical protein
MPCSLTVSEKENRINRLNHNNTKKLFHETSLKSAERILNSQKMLRGRKGLAGGGIYFALTPQEAHRKTEHGGIMLEANVNLGRIKKIKRTGAKNLTGCKLEKKGYESVLIPRRSPEIVVYNADQVKNIKISRQQ